MKKIALYFVALTVFGVMALSSCKQKAPETTPEATPVEEVVPAADTVVVADTVAVQ
jgi:hypothetical protein